MKKILLLLSFLLIGTSGCSSLQGKLLCNFEDKLAALASDTVASKLQCENLFAVQLDVTNAVKSLGVCKEAKKTGPIADAVCPIAVDSVVEKLASVAVPGEWKCKLTDVKGKVKPALTDLCRKLPVQQLLE